MKMTGAIERIQELVVNEDKIELFDNHIKLVVKYAVQLAKTEGEDVTDITIAALLHDLGRIRYGGKNHNITGARDARKILCDENYSSEKIEIICDAITAHTGDDTTLVNIFSEILRAADGLAHLDIVPLFLKLNLKKTDDNLKLALIKLIDKFETEWNTKITLSSAKDIGLEKYNATMLLLKSNMSVLEDDKND